MNVLTVHLQKDIFQLTNKLNDLRIYDRTEKRWENRYFECV